MNLWEATLTQLRCVSLQLVPVATGGHGKLHVATALGSVSRRGGVPVSQLTIERGL